MQEIKIRRIEPSDAEAVARLFEGPQAYAGTLQVPFPSISGWAKRLADISPGFHSLVAELDGEVVGQIGLEAQERARRRHVGYLGIVIKDGYQGRGIGSRLLAAIVDLAENWLNLSRLELTVFIDNDAGIALYKKHGFVIEGESAQFAFRDGKYVSVYHMARLREQQAG